MSNLTLLLLETDLDVVHFSYRDSFMNYCKRNLSKITGELEISFETVISQKASQTPYS